MTTNPNESQQTPAESQAIPPTAETTADATVTATAEAAAAAAAEPDPGAEVVITVDHVYLPLDAAGNARADWAVTSDSTTRVSQGTRVKVPTDLALLLDKQKQAVIV